MTKITLVNLTYIAFELNSAIDSGKYKNISIEEIKEQADKGKAFNYVIDKTKEDTDFSLLDEVKINSINTMWQDIYLALPNQERRKFGVENNGLSLLLAWTIELIQQKVWE